MYWGKNYYQLQERDTKENIDMGEIGEGKGQESKIYN
jgi:hypothetical protein